MNWLVKNAPPYMRGWKRALSRTNFPCPPRMWKMTANSAWWFWGLTMREMQGIRRIPRLRNSCARIHLLQTPAPIKIFCSIATPSIPGLHQAEQHIAEWMAWGEIKLSSQYREMDSFEQERVRKRERESLQQAQTSVKNAYELVIYLHNDGTVQSRKITMGAQSLFAALLQEKELRLFKEKIDAQAIMPNGLYPVWPPSTPDVEVRDLYQTFGQEPRLPKLLSQRAVVRTVEDAVKRGVLALRCKRPDGSEQWYWKSDIDMADWDKQGEAWLPENAMLNSLSPSAIFPDSLPGLWPADETGVKLATLCSWFDGKHMYEEKSHPDYPPEKRPIPKVDYKQVHQAVSKAVANGSLWLVLGNDSVYQTTPDPHSTRPRCRIVSSSSTALGN